MCSVFIFILKWCLLLEKIIVFFGCSNCLRLVISVMWLCCILKVCFICLELENVGGLIKIRLYWFWVFVSYCR